MTRNAQSLQSMLIISDYSSNDALKKLSALVSQSFTNVKEIEYVFLVNEKKMPEMLPMFKGLNYLCIGDFNWMGVLKSERIQQLKKHHNFDVCICFCDKMNKNVLKFTNSLNIKTKIGYERKSLPNFDLAFLVENPNDEYLLELVVKYFKNI